MGFCHEALSALADPHEDQKHRFTLEDELVNYCIDDEIQKSRGAVEIIRSLNEAGQIGVSVLFFPGFFYLLVLLRSLSG